MQRWLRDVSVEIPSGMQVAEFSDTQLLTILAPSPEIQILVQHQGSASATACNLTFAFQLGLTVQDLDFNTSRIDSSQTG